MPVPSWTTSPALTADLDAVLITGDVADHGLDAEYEQARQVLTSPTSRSKDIRRSPSRSSAARLPSYDG
jgi:3',5'-cyclic AMP phosphodiesterase CpdA